MKQIVEFLLDKCREFKLEYENFEFDKYRKRYDQLSFREKKKIANHWLKKYPEQAHFSFEYIELWLQKFVIIPAKVLEIGGWKGELASMALLSFSTIDIWHNYDLLEFPDIQICKDERYRLFSLDDYLWHKSLKYDYNALIATHMIEHIKWRELVDLINWIPPSIETVLFEAPIPDSEENINWKGDHSSHILEKGWKQVISEMKKRGFEAVYRINNTVIFKG